MGRRKAIETETRRELIVQAAIRLFAERGYHGVTLDEVAAEAGTTKPVVYDHAISKADLYTGVLERVHDDLLAHVDRHLVGRGSPEERLESALQTLFDWARLQPHAGRLLFRDDVTGDPHVASLHRAVRTRGNREIAARVLAGPLAHDRVHRDVVGEMLGGATRSLVRWWYEHPDVPRDALVDAAMSVLWRGLRSAGRAPDRGPPRTPHDEE